MIAAARQQAPETGARPSSARATTSALLFLAVLTLLRLWYAARTGLAEDESYYWQWSRHLALSYYDQGPGIAYLIRLGTLVLGDTPLGVRLVPILLGAGTGWFVFLSVRRWYGDRAALWTLGLLNIAPLLVVGGIIATYDGPQVFFWAAALYTLTRTVQEGRTGGWYLVGLLVGLGSLVKLTMLLFAPCVLIFLLLSPAHRRWLATPHPYLAFLLALALFSPVVVWNAQHEWMGFLHTFTLGNRTRDAKPLRWFGDFLGGQALALSPFVFLAELWVLRRPAPPAADKEGAGGEPGPPGGAAFLWAFGAPILILCMLLALRSKLEINWPAPTHLMGLAAVAVAWAAAWRSGRTAARAGIVGALVLSGVMTLVILFPGLPSAVGVPLSAETAKKANQVYGWPEIARGVQAARESLAREGKPVFVSGVNYRVNSILAFYLPGQPRTQPLYLNSRRDQYWVWTDPRALVGQNAVFALDDVNADAVALARRYFASVEPQAPIVVRRPGFREPVKTWYIYKCRDFKGYDPLAHLAGY